MGIVGKGDTWPSDFSSATNLDPTIGGNAHDVGRELNRSLLSHARPFGCSRPRRIFTRRCHSTRRPKDCTSGSGARRRIRKALLALADWRVRPLIRPHARCLGDWKSVAARWPRWPSSCAYRRKVGLIRKRSCGRSPVNQCAKLACRWKTLPRSVTVREAGRAGGRNRSRLLRDVVSP